MQPFKLKLKPEPAPAEWSGTGLVFIDPELMIAQGVYPGKIVGLLLNDSIYPARVGLPNIDLLHKNTIQIDIGIWDLIRYDLSGDISVDIAPPFVMDAIMVSLTNENPAEMTDEIKEAIRCRRYPVKPGYYLKIRNKMQDLFFKVAQIHPSRGGLIGPQTQITFNESDIEVFKKVFALKKIYENCLCQIDHIKMDIQGVIATRNRLIQFISRQDSIKRGIDRMKKEMASKENRINELLQKQNESQEELINLNEKIKIYQGPQTGEKDA